MNILQQHIDLTCIDQELENVSGDMHKMKYFYGTEIFTVGSCTQIQMSKYQISYF